MERDPFRKILELEAEIQRLCLQRRKISEKYESVSDSRKKSLLMRQFRNLSTHLDSLFEVARCTYLNQAAPARAMA